MTLRTLRARIALYILASQMLKKLIVFLEFELLIAPASLKLALKQSDRSATFLPMVLWQHGLITLKELDLIFDWVDTQNNLPC